MTAPPLGAEDSSEHFDFSDLSSPTPEDYTPLLREGDTLVRAYMGRLDSIRGDSLEARMVCQDRRHYRATMVSGTLGTSPIQEGLYFLLVQVERVNEAGIKEVVVRYDLENDGFIL